MLAAENFNRRFAFVQYSTDESIKNHFIQHHSKANTQSFINTQYKQPQSIYPIGTSTIQITSYSINEYLIHKAPDYLMVSHSKFKTFTFIIILTTLSFCAEPKAKSQNPSFNKEPWMIQSIANIDSINH